MKNLKAFILLFVCIVFLSIVTGATGYKNGFNDYKIQAVDIPDLGKSIDKVWNLTYEESENPLQVVKRQTNDGAVYIVTSKHFEICYACDSKGFGTRSLKKSWSSIPHQINKVIVNDEAVNIQKVITPKKIDDEKALGLIANYLPELLNEEYLHLLN